MRLSLLLAAIAMTACGGGSDAAPELPQSVSPGWSRNSFVAQPDNCWKAEYGGPGKVSVSVCRYADGVAFDMTQRRRPEADTVHFNQGRYFVVVKSDPGVGRAEITALVRAIQNSLKA